MSRSLEKSMRIYGGQVRWTAQSTEVCFESFGADQHGSRELRPNEKPLVTGRVLRPGAVQYLQTDVRRMKQCCQQYSGYTFTAASEIERVATIGYVKTRSIRKLRSGVEAIPAEEQ